MAGGYTHPSTITDSLETTEPVNARYTSRGRVNVPEGCTITKLTWHNAEEKDGPYLPLYKGTKPVTLTVVPGRSVEIPECAFPGSRWWKLTATAGESGEVRLMLDVP